MHPLLKNIHSWKVERISPSTYPRDIYVKLTNLSEKEIKAAVSLMRNGNCYRCRISKGRWHFGETSEVAIESAVKEFKRKGRRK